MKKFAIPCLHDRVCIDTNEIVADYHPLKLEEIRMLIDVAYLNKADRETVADVQERLIQGIMGMTCPKPSENCKPGMLSKKMAELEELFISAIKSDVAPNSTELALKLFNIMTFAK